MDLAWGLCNTIFHFPQEDGNERKRWKAALIANVTELPDSFGSLTLQLNRTYNLLKDGVFSSINCFAAKGLADKSQVAAAVGHVLSSTNALGTESWGNA